MQSTCSRRVFNSKQAQSPSAQAADEMIPFKTRVGRVYESNFTFPNKMKVFDYKDTTKF